MEPKNTIGKKTAMARHRAWTGGAAGMPETPTLTINILCASLALNTLSLALPMVILQVYDRIIPNESMDTLLLLTMGLCAVLLIEAFFRIARASITGWNAARFEHLAGCRSVDRMLACIIQDFEKDPPGTHLDRLYAIDQLRDYHAGQAKLLMIDLPFVGIFVGLIWYIGGYLALIPLALLLALGVSGWLLGATLQKKIRNHNTLDERRYSFIIEVLSHIQTVKILAMETLLQRRYERLQENGAVGTYDISFLGNLTQGLGAMFSNVVMISMVAVGATQVIAGSLSLGGLTACSLLAGRSIQPLLRGLGIWTQVQNVKLAEQHVEEIFTFSPESGVLEPQGDDDKFEKVSGAIRLKGVTFSYTEDDDGLFNDVELDIKPGEFIGIAGDTGSGKTTLMLLIMGLLRPIEGQVLHDGVATSERNSYHLRRQIAYLPQNPVLFRGTILDNLTMFDNAEKVDQALAASKLIGLHDMVHRMPSGYESEVGDGASAQLPGGIRQLIAICRALTSEYKIVLFDEANSGFDPHSEMILKEALAELKGKVTVVMASHRPSLLALSDRTFRIKDKGLERWERSAPGAPAGSSPKSSKSESADKAAPAKLALGAAS